MDPRLIPDEATRRQLLVETNSAAVDVAAAHPEDPDAAVRADLERQYGQVWTTDEATGAFTFTQFAAPYVFVVRKADDVSGRLMFIHRPRLYYNFQPA